VRQPSEDRARYYRQLRDTVRNSFLPELTGAQAIDAAAIVDRILAEFIVEEEAAAELSAEFGAAFAAILDPDAPSANGTAAVTPAEFDALRARAADAVAATASDDVAGLDRALQLVAVERAFLERVDALRTVVLAEEMRADDAPDPNACSVTVEQLTGYLRKHFPDSPDLTVEQLSVVPGGRSKETILVTLTGTTELPTEVIVRKDRPVGLLATRAADEYAVIKAVHDFGGVPIPEPFFAEDTDHELGEGTFLVMARVPGHKAGEFFPDLAAPTEHREELGRHIAASLARLHALPLDQLGDTGLDADAVVSAASIVAMVEGIVTRIGELSGPPCASVPLARAWLVEHVADVVPAPRVCLLQGDFGFHNMLIDGDHVTALVDWEAATIGPAARELAAAWSAATTLMLWTDFVDAYVRAGGDETDADPRAIAYYRVLSALGGFMASRMGGDMFRTGTKRDLLTAHSGLDSHFRCARNLARTLDDAMQTTGVRPPD
jgi:aminoglycoside phosphotransferase (APT) family kinase protein